MIQGYPDGPVIAASSLPYPLRVLTHTLETVVERTDSGKPVAWFPVNLRRVATHPSGRTWAAETANHFGQTGNIGWQLAGVGQQRTQPVRPCVSHGRRGATYQTHQRLSRQRHNARGQGVAWLSRAVWFDRVELTHSRCVPPARRSRTR